MKVLFDSNFYVAEGLGGEQPVRVLRALTNARAKIFVSAFILDEVRRVLSNELHASNRDALKVT